MAFEARDFHELVQALEQHPEWRAELRRLLLSEELLNLPETVRELAEAQRHTDEHIERLVIWMQELAQRVDELAQRLDQLTQRVDQLAQRVDELAQMIKQMTAQMQKMLNDVGKLKEYYLEQKYFTRAAAYFRKLLLRIRPVPHSDFGDMLADAHDKGILTEKEVDDLIQTDVVAKGKRREDGQEVYLIVEVSWGIGIDDLNRAYRRAQTFAKTGVNAMPVVAGEWLSPDAQEPARVMGVTVVLDGSLGNTEQTP